ncbi:MAG: type II secretion system protein [Planctomycetes bacterium]|nr:type II secretion system protein [Planctomycetota bacterium]
MLKAESRAFTLVELLVVVSIITVLAALLLPALQSTLDISRKITCASSLRQIEMGTLEYTEDNRGTFPCYKDNSTSWPYVFGDWGIDKTNFYRDYLPHPKLYYCPVALMESAAARTRLEAMPEIATSLGDWTQSISYCYFFGEDCWYGGNKRQGKIRISEVTAPSRSTVIADCMRFGTSSPYTISATTSSWNHKGDLLDTIGGNMAYVDGHVKWMQGFGELLQHRQKMKNNDSKSYAAEQPHDL